MTCTKMHLENNLEIVSVTKVAILSLVQPINANKKPKYAFFKVEL